MARVLNNMVFVLGTGYPAGSTPPPEIAALIGDHAWTDDGCPAEVVAPVELPPSDDAPSVPSDGGTDPDPLAVLQETTQVIDPSPVPAEPAVAPVDLPEPRRAGPGASKDAWVAYAAVRGVAVDAESMTRDDIIAAVDAARA
jgi:hypothetical protein